MKNSVLYITLGLLAVSFTMPVRANSPTIVKYEVFGKSAKELVDFMNTNGPDGHWARTDQRWEYSYNWLANNGDVKAKDIAVIRNIIITMPIWRGYLDVSTCLQNSWDTMYQSLDNHEKKHVSLGNPVTERLMIALSKVSSQKTGKALERAMNAAADTVFEANNKVQEAFDDNTSHGSKDPVDPIVFKECP